ncbi:TIGR03885 family FMN-dependent LLM class oxidoreductase [Parvularcula dongshanensis]|uniref:Putative non-F420 flavinoid oxidoreductase n=1 Tax=Parvularcula dongshanensis TaxID=1173995 RepID=A0A840I3D5_9PROT|nr:TIGR03885 family FMN-dependent LLM class oxidoreductase [Parvularcula dongshanensis]MBB4659516.1 putative non-F420 flavinoid oxidoreductase [Parvularcula dongshanensis]
MRYGIHASHEQFDPTTLLTCVQEAEAAGFEVVTASDHLHPWNERPGHAAFVWSWLGAAMQTTKLDFRTVSCPGYRYHPAILAQAGATLGFMHPGRIAMCLGSGERLNEATTGIAWPVKSERNAKLQECIGVMKRLWAGETVTHRGRVIVEEVKLYTRPEEPIPAFGAAVTPQTARWLGGFADGLVTLAGGPPEDLRRVVDAFREGGGEGKPITCQVKLAWGEEEGALREDALRSWGTNLLQGQVVWEIPTPKQFEEATAYLTTEDLDRTVRVSTDLGQHAAWIAEYAECGVDELILHNVATNQRQFVDAFGQHVLPQLK